MDLPYRAEYAKSNRSSCKNCKSSIGKDTLRLAVMVQSPRFDGKSPNWYHFICFFNKQRPKTTDDIEHFESLRYDDQKKIKEKVEECGSSAVIGPPKKGKKRGAENLNGLKDFKIEYSKSGRAACRGCEQKILKDEIRISKKDYETEVGMKYGGQDLWHHLTCFANLRSELGYFAGGDVLPGFKSLKKDDQQEVKKQLPMERWLKEGTLKRSAAELDSSVSDPATSSFAKDNCGNNKSDASEIATNEIRPVMACTSNQPRAVTKKLRKYDESYTRAIKQEEMPEKKVKAEDEVDSSLEKEIIAQNKIMFKYRDQLKENLSKKELEYLLESNEQQIPPGEDRMLDRLSDIMTFGALTPCKVCKTGQFVFNKVGYVCQGNLSEWTKCETIEAKPERKKFNVPTSLAKEYAFLKKYKYTARNRAFKQINRTNSVAVKKEEDETDSKPKVERAKPPLYQMEFVILGQPSRGKDVVKKEITKLGGKVVTKIKNSVMAVISTAEEVEKMNARMTDAQTEDIHVVSEDFLDFAKEYSGRIPDLVLEKSIADWGSNPNTRLPPEPSKSQKSKSMYTKSGPSKVKVTVKDGSAVDPDSGISNISHVYSDANDKYTVILGVTDVQRNRNSFYKLQIIQSDSGNQFWVFRSWGRIGTNIGGHKLDVMGSLYDAKHFFCELYEEKTGNAWENRHNFVKVPNKMYPIEVDYGESDEKLQINNEIPSNLPEPVQNLMKIIFDVSSMKKVMMEFELDTEKMPLGKLSKKQLQNAYSVLSELQNLLNENGSNSQFIDATNRFYTFVPHSFGVDNPPIIKDSETIKKKIDMLDNLMELEIAYNLMKTSGGDNSIDAYYEQLKTDIEILDIASEEFTIIQEYVKNTHAPTHSQYDLDVIQVFKVSRQGEEKRYKPFRKLHNRKLLWHGSRKTNFAGILGQGLRIAPPEAPVTGYMFGKGIYFADMVSKSANYCCTNRVDSTGLMLLCEVALGEMYERPDADYIEKLPKGKHSCKGLGRTHPDPTQVKKINEVDVPIGKPTSVSTSLNSCLLYNEYIVYDIAQVNIKYLLQMDFKYKY